MDGTATVEQITRQARRIHKSQVSWRRHLHQNPETANEEFETTRFLRAEIKKLGLRILPIKMKTGLLVELKGSSPGKTVAVRTDIDALPILEQSGVPFKSRRPGFMHACGHDMHMATVLGLAAVLKNFQKKLKGNVRFIFQPAEEKPPGGATPMIENGALKNVSMIFGLHVDPHLATGKIGVRDGVTMASVIDFDLVVHGRGGHAARPQHAVDAIVIAAEVIESLQKIVSRETDPILPTAVTFGKIEGGTARNVIADRVLLTGTARTLSARDSRRLPKMIKRTADNICKAHGAKAEMNIIARYPVLHNSPKANRLFERNFKKLFGAGKIEQTDQTLGGEDFACYLQEVLGAMFRLGVMNKSIGADKSWHSPHFIADEQALFFGTSVLAASVLDYLNG
ncbi:MAG: M20 family metallopeptidase [bacterium]|nr:M20 family metallopeptidase [bacterium]